VSFKVAGPEGLNAEGVIGLQILVDSENSFVVMEFRVG
jgi:hypothetical protein